MEIPSNACLELIRAEERIKTVKRLLDSGEYLSENELRAILCIHKEEADEDGTI